MDIRSVSYTHLEAIAETSRLHQDAEQAKSKYGLACSEMCIGYNHRIFANNVEVCIEYYNYALKHFEEGKYYRDVYVVLLNIIQTYLSRNEYVEGEIYLNKFCLLYTSILFCFSYRIIDLGIFGITLICLTIISQLRLQFSFHPMIVRIANTQRMLVGH